jgi:hypothetical protein
MSGPVPKPASKRRRRNVPKSYGAAHRRPRRPPTFTNARSGSTTRTHWSRRCGRPSRNPARPASTAKPIGSGCGSSAGTPTRRCAVPRPISGRTWAAIQHGLTELLVSPAAKRRVAIEVKAPGPDTDEVRAVAMIGTCKSKLKPV